MIEFSRNKAAKQDQRSVCIRELSGVQLGYWPFCCSSDNWTSILVRFCKLISLTMDLQESRVAKELLSEIYTCSLPLDCVLDTIINVGQLVRADCHVTTAKWYG